MIKFLVPMFLLALFNCSKHDDSDQNAADHAYTIIGGKYHTGLLKDTLENKARRTYMKSIACPNLPESFDLREIGTVPDIRNQGSCGSCWAFSKTGSLESALMASGMGKIDLAEQELVSCDSKQYGCEGGLLSDFDYQIKKGQGLEADFPYTSGRTGSNGRCKDIKKAAKGVSFSYVGNTERRATEEELKCALYTTHTIPWITVGATNAWGSPPKSEKTVYSRCSRSETNHAVGVVGWFKDPESGKTAFIMKNSWGTNWGDKGYMSLPLGCDNFGEEIAFITVK